MEKNRYRQIGWQNSNKNFIYSNQIATGATDAILYENINRPVLSSIRETKELTSYHENKLHIKKHFCRPSYLKNAFSNRLSYLYKSANAEYMKDAITEITLEPSLSNGIMRQEGEGGGVAGGGVRGFLKVKPGTFLPQYM